MALSKNYFMFPELTVNWVYDKRNYEGVTDEEIAKKQGLDPNDLDVKILIYEDQVKAWFLEIAKRLKQDNEAGFTILQIAVSYIEGNQQYREGKLSYGNSQSFFIKGMRRIFDKENVPKTVLSFFYDQVRCGLFHDGITKKNVLISCELPDPVRNINGKIMINPHKFLDKIKEDFDNYVNQLKNKENIESRTNFELRRNQ
jgi:hypothetical protein